MFFSFFSFLTIYLNFHLNKIMRRLLFLLLLVAIINPTLCFKKTSIYLPAVQETPYGYKGVLAKLEVEIKEGNGHVYVDTWPLTKISTQASARLAKEVACNLVNLDCSKYDFFYSIRSDVPIVGGPSGGAAMTIATLASLLDLNLSQDVLITGTIVPNGLIGPVGGILEKAEAVSKKAKIFLIPLGQSRITVSKSEVQRIGPITIETSKEEELDIITYAKEHWNLEVKEVSTIQEAFEYFTNYKFKEITQKPAEQRYKELMKEMASNLIQHSKNLYSELKDSYNKAILPYQYQLQLKKILDRKPEYELFEQGNYYSAASKAFSNAIYYKYGIKLIELLNSENPQTYTKKFIQKVESDLPSINLTTNPEILAILEERLNEAKENLEDAWKNYYNNNFFDALYYACFAAERIYTLDLWKNFASNIEEEYEINSTVLQAIANDQLQDAIGYITYAELYGASQNLLNDAKRIYDKAKESFDEGNYLLSIILSIKAKSKSELALELQYTDMDKILEVQRDLALRSISTKDTIIGPYYYEYAQTLESEDKISALTYYIYAERLSSLSSLLKKEEYPAKEIAKEEILERKSESETNYASYFVIAVVFLAVGYFVGSTSKPKRRYRKYSV